MWLENKSKLIRVITINCILILLTLLSFELNLNLFYILSVIIPIALITVTGVLIELWNFNLKIFLFFLDVSFISVLLYTLILFFIGNKYPYLSIGYAPVSLIFFLSLGLALIIPLHLYSFFKNKNKV